MVRRSDWLLALLAILALLYGAGCSKPEHPVPGLRNRTVERVHVAFSCPPPHSFRLTGEERGQLRRCLLHCRPLSEAEPVRPAFNQPEYRLQLGFRSGHSLVLRMGNERQFTVEQGAAYESACLHMLIQRWIKRRPKLARSLRSCMQERSYR